MITRQDNPRARGLTLIELVISMTLMTLLTAGIVSAVVLASRAIPSDDDASLTRNAEAAAPDLAAELSCALWFTERTATAVTFAVPDRDGDTTPDTIRYAWAGTGSPLTRAYNGGAAVTVLDSVEDFALDYRTRIRTELGEPTQVESEELILASHNPVGGSLNDYPIEAAKWAAQYFVPALPADALSWSVTQVSIVAKVDGLDSGAMWVQLRTADDSGKPTTTVIDEVLLLESTLSTSMLWCHLSFANAASLSPTGKYCIVLKFRFGPRACKVQFEDHGDGTLPDRFLTTTNRGGTWTADPDEDLVYAVKGRYLTESSPTETQIRCLCEIGIALQATDDASSRIETAAAVLNEPEVSDP